MDASDIMTRNVISVDADTPASEIAELMLEYGISAVPVVENGALVGIVSESDLLRCAENKTERRRSRWLEFITPNSDRAAKGAWPASAHRVSDQKIRDALFAELASHKWVAPPNEVSVIVREVRFTSGGSSSRSRSARR